MSTPQVVIDTLKALGFNGDKKSDVISLVFSLVSLAVFIIFFSELAAKLWFLVVALYFLMRLIIHTISSPIANLLKHRRSSSAMLDFLESLPEEQSDNVEGLFSRGIKWERITVHESELTWIYALEENGIIEFQQTRAADQNEELDSVFSRNSYFNVRISKACLKLLSKSNYKNAINLGFKHPRL